MFCHASFPANEVLEHFTVGRRLAFDPARGRLWVVCRVCGRWNLAPIEDRWEALEELERLAQDRAKLLVQTDNIGLLRAGELELVRVGRAELREEAWWRYGRVLTRRRAVDLALHGAAFAAALVTTGVAYGFLEAGAQWLRFGSTAWRGEVFCQRCGRPTRRVSFSRAAGLFLVLGPDGTPALRGECGACALRAQQGWIEWNGPEAERALRRILARQNASGATAAQVSAATASITELGSAEALVTHAAERRPQLREFARRKYRTASLALEIAANDDIERRLLELEARALELRWKEEEALAAIADGELTPLARLDRLIHKIRP